MESGEGEKKDVVSVKLSRELASQLRKMMDVGDTYESVIRRLLEHYKRARGDEK
ncbi:MAG: hypothetical protein J7J91_06835 [Deltaproteobacteria bacterium]|nr:hypothetical protein [Deltaproteobacteria bacterium]